MRTKMTGFFSKFAIFLVLLSMHPDCLFSARIIPPIFSRVIIVSGPLINIHVGWAQKFYHERGRYFEGDILLPAGDDSLKAGSNSPRWKNGVIPYYFHPSIRVSGRQAIKAAMQDIQSKTCVRFTNRKKEKDYVYITSFNQGCFSYVGRQGFNQQLNLGPGCWHKTTIVHELVHAVGFWHEQSRMDRDKHVNIEWNNIPKSLWREFRKHSPLNNFGTEYDLRSVMHYSYKAFAWNKRKPTITTKQPYPLRLLGTGDDTGGLTSIDALQINRMYNCTFDELPRKNQILNYKQG